MRPSYRSHVNKGRSAKRFRKSVQRTRGANFSVMRGGIRL